MIFCDFFRRFTHSHLAQLKFILPEAIDIKKLLVFDERTSCMKPDLNVSVNPDAVVFDAELKPECGSMSLRKLFRVRLKDFWESHPEVWCRSHGFRFAYLFAKIYLETALIDNFLCL